jgi:hypothetical protein
MDWAANPTFFAEGLMSVQWRSMSRERHQNGWVEEVGKKVKKWKGHYYVYDADGKRRHHSADLGKKSGTPKWKAEQQLRNIIERQTGAVQPRVWFRHAGMVLDAPVCSDAVLGLQHGGHAQFML